MDGECVNLKLCLYGAKAQTVERSFKRQTTLNELQQDIRKLFNVESDRETKLWINSVHYNFKPTSSPSSSSPQPPPSASPASIKNNISNNNNNSIASNNTNGNPPPVTSNNETNGSLSPSKSENNLKESALSSSSSNLNSSTITDNIKPPPLPPPATGWISNSESSTLMKYVRTSGIEASSPDTENENPASDENQATKTLVEAGVNDSDVVTLEVINDDGTWPSSRPRFGTVATRSSRATPGLCGLSNMGNTCFMNAALQCLSNTPPLTNYILTDKFLNDININNPLGMRGEIARTYSELIKVIWSGNNTSFLPREFKCAVSRFAPQFNGFAQQDCQELTAFLLDGLHEDLNRIQNKPYIETKNDVERRPDEVVAEESWSNYKKRNDSIVVDTFHAMLKSTLVCPGCQLVSVTFDPFCYLSLPLPVKREKQVNLIFLPAISQVDESKIHKASDTSDPDDADLIRRYEGLISFFDGTLEEYAEQSSPENRPKSCKMQVPRSGPVSEICDIVKRMINEERSPTAGDVKQDNLVVAELTDGKISKIYESNEHYNQLSDDIVVVEKGSNYVIPLHIRNRMSETFTLKVAPRPTLQLRDCINQFTSLERLGADDPWYCPKCKKHQQATKKFDIWSLPKVLIIHLKRFSFSRSWRDKIDTLVEFPVDGLDMSEYVLNPAQREQKRLTYDLIGVANHFGGLGGGHYTAYAKNESLDAWYSFDDALVTPTSSSNVVTRSAYVLFYQLREDCSSSIN